MSVALIDIDKAINDVRGHSGGDSVLADAGLPRVDAAEPADRLMVSSRHAAL